MLTIDVHDLRRSYPLPARSELITRTNGYYTVGGALLMYMRVAGQVAPTIRAPSRAQLAWALQLCNMELGHADAYNFALAINDFNDAGNYAEAWSVLDSALNYKEATNAIS